MYRWSHITLGAENLIYGFGLSYCIQNLCVASSLDGVLISNIIFIMLLIKSLRITTSTTILETCIKLIVFAYHFMILIPRCNFYWCKCRLTLGKGRNYIESSTLLVLLYITDSYIYFKNLKKHHRLLIQKSTFYNKICVL